eukprot:8229561-Pyramimonas_sp.AAC.1
MMTNHPHFLEPQMSFGEEYPAPCRSHALRCGRGRTIIHAFAPPRRLRRAPRRMALTGPSITSEPFSLLSHSIRSASKLNHGCTQAAAQTSG